MRGGGRVSWRQYWAALPEVEKDRLRDIGRRFVGMVDGIDDDGSILSIEAMTEICAWQELGNDVLSAYSAWLSRTKAAFEARGIPWTTVELARRAHLWGHE